MNAYERLLDFLVRLEDLKIAYTLEHDRPDAIMVTAVVPGEHWEVEYFPDGHVEVEVFRTQGPIRDESALEEFFAKHSE
jgi:hypothetical protein